MKYFTTVLILVSVLAFLPAPAQVQKKKTITDKAGSGQNIILTRMDYYGSAPGFKRTYQFQYIDKSYSVDYMGGNITDLMKSSPDAMMQMGKFRTKRIVSVVAAVCVPVFTIGGFAAVLNKDQSSAYTAFGGAFAMYLVKTIFYNLSGRNLEKAVSSYNESLGIKDKSSFHPQLKPVFVMGKAPKGIFPAMGLSLTF